MAKTSNGASADSSATVANPNGPVALVFTYGGQALTYQQFLASFYLTLPGGGGVTLGANQYYGYAGANQGTLALGVSYPLGEATSPIDALLPANSLGAANLAAAFTQWATNQAASPGQTAYANLYLSHYSGGRIFLSNGSLGLGATGEPVPNSTIDPAYGLIYDIIEPFIAAQIGNPTIPGNLADITDVDWFSLPITLNVWSYDFRADSGALTCTATANGGNGSAIWNALLLPGGSGPTNQYPSIALPAPGGSTTPCRLIAPTMAATSGYYSDRQSDLFPYSYFDDYLIYLNETQAGATSLFTMTSSYAGSGAATPPVQEQAQSFSFAVDFSAITTASYLYPCGAATRITPASKIVLTGSTSLLGSSTAPFTITLPWALGTQQFTLPSNPVMAAANDAVAQGWLSFSGASGPSGTYSALPVTIQDAGGTVLTPVSGEALVQVIYSVNTNPLSGQTDDLYAGGTLDGVTVSGTTGLTSTPNATYSQTADGAVLIVTTDANGALNTIAINDFGSGPGIGQGWQCVVPANATGLFNNQSFTVTLAQMPQLRNVFILAGATYATQPATLSVVPTNGFIANFTVNAADLIIGFTSNPNAVTLSQPAGIYGANAGYSIAGLPGYDETYSSLQNDVFGWIVADLLAALNTGLVAAPAIFPPTGLSVGASSNSWFTPGSNPYQSGLWGAAAWAGQSWNGQPVSDFWDSWAWQLFNVPGGTNAYNFAFTDRFEQNVLVSFSPPPASMPPSSDPAVFPVLLEVVITDSPVLSTP